MNERKSMAAVNIGDMPQAIMTTAEHFADGSSIERLRDNLLVCWRNGDEIVGPCVEHNGHLYAAANLDPTLEEMLHLPSGTENFGSAEGLITTLEKAIS